MVRIMTKQEADEFSDIKQISYRPEDVVLLEDQVVDKEDSAMMKLITNFEAHRSDLDRIRMKVMRTLVWVFIKDSLKRDNFRVVSSMIGIVSGKSVDHEGEEDVARNTNEELVGAIDEYVGQMSLDQDPAVAGGKAYGGRNRLAGYTKRLYHQTAYQGARGIAHKLLDSSSTRPTTLSGSGAASSSS